MSHSTWFSRIMIVVIAFTLCGGPQLLAAQQAAPVQPTQGDQAQDSSSNDQQSVGTSQESATPDPSKGPLKPHDTELPNAPSASQQQTSSAPDQAQSPQPTETPLGAAAAEAGKVSGGAASRPAGTAIAPAKQHQTRSLLIKIGAIAAGAAALGLVYGLSRGTPSVPPGASTATTTTTSASTANH